MATCRFPRGTKRDTPISINGIHRTVCAGDPFRCDGKAWDAHAFPYFDAEGNPAASPCDAVSVELPVGINCCSCKTICVLVPLDFDDTPDAQVWAVDYPCDGSPSPDLAPAGDALIGIVAEAASCSTSSYDNMNNNPIPAGYKAIHILTAGLQF